MLMKTNVLKGSGLISDSCLFLGGGGNGLIAFVFNKFDLEFKNEFNSYQEQMGRFLQISFLLKEQKVAMLFIWSLGYTVPHSHVCCSYKAVILITKFIVS